jgi:glucokinase
MILVGDVGGTKTLLEVGTVDNGRWLPAFGARYAAVDHADLHEVMRDFLRKWAGQDGARGALTSACFGVAGPVFDHRAQMTNLSWVVDGRAIENEFGIQRVSVVNDFAASATGVEMLAASDLVILQAGEPIERAPRWVIGAGTGLGVAHLVWAGGRYQVVAGEGGHAGFAPATLEQLELWRDLFAHDGRVTIEHVVSGPGLVRIYNFLQRASGAAPRAELTPAMIVDGALQLGDAASLRALDLWIACYGEVAGNLALGVLARGGVYIAGGIAPRILPRMQAGGFLASFSTKGSYTDAVQKIPVSVVTNERLGLLGCALIAAR